MSPSNAGGDAAGVSPSEIGTPARDKSSQMDIPASCGTDVAAAAAADQTRSSVKPASSAPRHLRADPMLADDRSLKTSPSWNDEHSVPQRELQNDTRGKGNESENASDDAAQLLADAKGNSPTDEAPLLGPGLDSGPSCFATLQTSNTKDNLHDAASRPKLGERDNKKDDKSTCLPPEHQSACSTLPIPLRFNQLSISTSVIKTASLSAAPTNATDQKTGASGERPVNVTEMPRAPRRKTIHQITGVGLPMDGSANRASAPRCSGKWTTALTLNKSSGRSAEVKGSNLPDNWTKVLRALQRGDVEEHYDAETTRGYYQYYFKTHKTQWQLMDTLAIIVALFFILSVYSFKLNRFDLNSKLAIVLAIMVILPVAELVFSFTPYHARHALSAHRAMLLGYGMALGTMELFMQSLNPPEYMLLFLLLMYTDIGCHQVQAVGFIGVVSALTDVVCMYISARNWPSLQQECEQSLPCMTQIGMTALFYFCVNVFGITYALMSWRYTRKTYLTHRTLMENQKTLLAATGKAEKTALSILPAKVWNDLRGGRSETGMETLMHKNIMTRICNVTVLFGDIAGFTNLSGMVTSTVLVGLLNEIFQAFDEFVETCGCEKIKTIGDCYMLCAGVPEPVDRHELRAVTVGLKMVDAMKEISQKQHHKLAMRIGAHTGDVMAGLIGEERLIYDVFSRDVTIASVMEQTGKPLRVHISKRTRTGLGDHVRCTEGPMVTALGMEINTYFVDEDQEHTVFEEEKTPLEASSRRTKSAKKIIPSTLSVQLSEGRQLPGNKKNSIFEASSKEQTDPAKAIRWYDCRFRDEALENEFQVTLVTKCSGKFAIGVAMCIFTSLIFLAIGLMMYRDATCLPVMCGIVLQGFLFWIAVSYLSQSSTTSAFVKWLIRVNGGLNSQIMGSVNILLVYAGILTQLFRANPAEFLFLTTQVDVLIIVATTFTRLRMIYIVGVSMFIMTSFHVVTVTFRENFIKGYEYVTILYQFAMVLAVLLVTWRMEMCVRENYLAKKDLVQKKYEIEDIRIKFENMLYKLLPREVVERLASAPNKEIADGVPQAGIMFCTICNFKITDIDTMGILNDVISKFDRMTSVYEVEKIKSIGTTYMAASGLMRKTGMSYNEISATAGKPHYVHLAQFALALRARMVQLNSEYSAIAVAKGLPSTNYKLRIGIDVGPVVAGVIGKSKFAYDIWGEHVNLASRMESTGVENNIQITERAYEVLRDDFIVEQRGTVEVKGKGPMLTWWLLDRKYD